MTTGAFRERSGSDPEPFLIVVPALARAHRSDQDRIGSKRRSIRSATRLIDRRNRAIG